MYGARVILRTVRAIGNLTSVFLVTFEIEEAFLSTWTSSELLLRPFGLIVQRRCMETLDTKGWGRTTAFSVLPWLLKM